MERPQAPSTRQEVPEKVKRRAAFAAVLGEPLLNFRGEPVTLGLPTTDEPLPKRIGMAHVRAVRTATEGLVGLTRYCGGQADQFAAAVARYTRWMAVPATDEVKTQLAGALAELYTDAGWACYDSGIDGFGYFTRGLGLGHQAKDAYVIANTAWNVGVTLVRSGHPNDALKFFTLGKLRLDGFPPGPATLPPDDPRLPTLTARLARGCATAYAVMGGHGEATRHLAEANDGSEPRDAFERAGADHVTAGIQLDLDRLDAAEQFATSALRGFGEGPYRRGRTLAELVLAEVHVRAGEPHGLALAHHAIAGVSTLQSVAARRQRLIPLATALEARPGTDTRELARIARQVAVTRI
jgi:hypothetical protein